MAALWRGKHRPSESWRERLARGLTAFFGLVLLAFGGFTAKLAAAKGEQVEKHITPFSSLRLCREISPRIMMRKQHSPIRRQHWPASFLWSSPANAGYAVRRIDSRYAADLHLSTLFSAASATLDFLVKKSPFFRFCRAFTRNVKNMLRRKLFSAQTQLHCTSSTCKQRNRLQATRQRLTSGQ